MLFQCSHVGFVQDCCTMYINPHSSHQHKQKTSEGEPTTFDNFWTSNIRIILQTSLIRIYWMFIYHSNLTWGWPNDRSTVKMTRKKIASSNLLKFDQHPLFDINPFGASLIYIIQPYSSSLYISLNLSGMFWSAHHTAPKQISGFANLLHFEYFVFWAPPSKHNPPSSPCFFYLYCFLKYSPSPDPSC